MQRKSVIIVPKGHIVTHDLHDIQRFVCLSTIPSLSFSRASAGHTLIHGASSHFLHENLKVASSRTVFSPLILPTDKNRLQVRSVMSLSTMASRSLIISISILSAIVRICLSVLTSIVHILIMLRNGQQVNKMEPCVSQTA